MPIKPSAEFKTPDGTRYATVVDGAHVVGDVPLTPVLRAAVADLVGAARTKLAEADDSELGQRQQATLARIRAKVTRA